MCNRAFLGSCNSGSHYFWAVKLCAAIDDVKHYACCNDTGKAHLKSVLKCVEVLTEI